MRFLILFNLWFAFALGAAAATFYVDFAAGADANAGTSTGAAFKHCPGDPKATSTAASTTLSAGDTVLFKGGITYLLTADYVSWPTAGIALSWSGTAGNPITYDGNSAGTWGTGKPIITDNHGTNRLAAFYTATLRSNVVVRNFIIQEIGGSATPPPDLGSAVAPNQGGGVGFGGGARNCTVQDCEFYELGYYWNVKPMDDNALWGVGVEFSDSRDCVLTNCDFKKMGWGFYAKATTLLTNLTIANCRMSESIKWRLDLNNASGGATGGITITNCDLFNCGEFGDGTWSGYGPWPHMDGIFLRSDNSTAYYSTNADATGINFCGNRFWDTNQVTANGTAVIYLAGGTSANIWNNTFVHTVKTRTVFIAGARGAPHTPQVARIYNNTFLQRYEKAIGVSQTIPMHTLDIRNNVFVDVENGSGANTLLHFEVADVATNLTVDYNFYCSSNTSGDYVVWTGVGTGGITMLQANGQEAHGLASSTPKLADISYGTGPQCNLNDLRLASNSPAIGAGLAFNSFFTGDKNGVTRGAVWDMGAFEYAAGAPPGGATNVLNVGTVNAGTLRLGP